MGSPRLADGASPGEPEAMVGHRLDDQAVSVFSYDRLVTRKFEIPGNSNRLMNLMDLGVCPSWRAIRQITLQARPPAAHLPECLSLSTCPRENGIEHPRRHHHLFGGTSRPDAKIPGNQAPFGTA